MNEGRSKKHLHSVYLACLSKPWIPRKRAIYSLIADGRKGQEQQTSKYSAACLEHAARQRRC